jgi:hypothetical protein
VLDLSRLSKILARTTSPIDAEALASIRAANRMVKDADTTWPRVLGVEPAAPSPRLRPAPGPRPPMRGGPVFGQPPEMSLREVLEVVMGGVRDAAGSASREFARELKRPPRRRA